MRIRSLHPSYLDSKGLVALRRETLLAKHVLEGKTKWYTNHPQLIRFKSQSDPLSAINQYLTIVEHEASQRWYSFDSFKIWPIAQAISIPVTQGQIDYEFQRLSTKLQHRDPKKYSENILTTDIKSHPLFTIIPWEIEVREKL